MRIRHVALVLSGLSVFALAACGSSQPANTSAAPGEQAKTSESAAQAGHFHAELALAGRPAVTSDGKNIVVPVKVTNDGLGAFGSETEPHNVNLGAHAIDAAGNIVINDLSRGRLPQISSGATQEASIFLPMATTLGHRVELLPVQEKVGWFDQWGTKPLIIGPFDKCSGDAAGRVCDGSGRPLPVLAIQH